MKNNKISFPRALSELNQCFAQANIWLTFAREDLRNRYKRTLIGMLWIPVSFLMFVGVKVLIFSKLNASSYETFALYLVIGFWIWATISAFIVDSCGVFTRMAGYVKSTSWPYPIYIYQSIARNLVTYAFNFLVVLLLCLIIQGKLTWGYVFFVPVTLVYCLNALWVSLFLGSLSVRYRDMAHLVQTIMRMMFFLTPVLWMPEQLGEIGRLVSLWNPFSHYISIIREPIISGSIPLLSWAVVGCITMLGSLMSIVVYEKMRSKIFHYV